MCAPAVLGVATAATGVLGAVSQHNAASAQANAANQAATSNYKYQLKMRERSWDRERFRYNNQIHQFNQQVDENNSSAAKAYASEQRRLNEIFRKAAFENQGRMAEMLGANGKMAAAGRTGKSADRVTSSLIAAFGRNQATQAESLISANQAYTARTGSVRDQLRNANRTAYNQVSVGPQPGVAPPRPVMNQGPSGLSLATGILSAGVSGFGAYQQYKAPDTVIPTIPTIPTPQV